MKLNFKTTILCLAFGISASVAAQASDVSTYDVINKGVVSTPGFTITESIARTTAPGTLTDYDFIQFFVAGTVTDSWSVNAVRSSFSGFTGLTSTLYNGQINQNNLASAVVKEAGITNPDPVLPSTRNITTSGVTNNFTLSSGWYTLALVGTGTNALGGSYSGTMSISPVPEAETYSMMLMGLGLMGFIARRRRNDEA